MRILFVKLTSMGDLIHALPALTDAKEAIPGISFDWVIDKNFSEVARWHPAIKNIFCTEHRKWRSHPLQSVRKGEIRSFLANLRRQQYDLVIDGQTNLKSALIMLLTRGQRCGLDKNSAREWIAHLAYQKKYAIPKEMHAIHRLRLLFSQVLHYPLSASKPNYGIQQYPFSAPNVNLPAQYLIYVHHASWVSKLWPLNYWDTLIKLADNEHLHVLLPWGNLFEKQRAEHLAARNKNAHVLSYHTLSEQAWLLKNSQGAICSDTGLSHLAAALDVPAVTLYGPTSATLIGTTGVNQGHYIANFPCLSCYQYACHYQNQKREESSCLSAIKPESLWQQFCHIRQNMQWKGG
jgi:heptosyltransferase-1